jgi:hypothetical protein
VIYFVAQLLVIYLLHQPEYDWTIFPDSFELVIYLLYVTKKMQSFRLIVLLMPEQLDFEMIQVLLSDPERQTDAVYGSQLLGGER